MNPEASFRTRLGSRGTAAGGLISLAVLLSPACGPTGSPDAGSSSSSSSSGGGQSSSGGGEDPHLGACGYAADPAATADVRCGGDLNTGFQYDSAAQQIAFDLSIANDADAVGPFYLGFYLFPHGQPQCDGYLISRHRLAAGIPAGPLQYVDLRGTIDMSEVTNVPQGSYRFGLVVDYLNEIAEPDEADNTCLRSSAFTYP